eukprot:scaffold4055_cov129-Skeletonema_dohrnii-CCMP3373.AAC.2
MPRLIETGTPEKAGDMTPVTNKVHQPPPPVVTASARPPQQRTQKNPLKQQQQQQQHKDTSSNQRKDTSSSNQTKKLFDCVERPSSIQNNITTTTAPNTTFLSSGKESMMILSLLHRSRELLGNTNQPKHATSSSSWHGVGIFRQEGVDNNDDDGKGNGHGGRSMDDEERLLFQSVSNSIPKQQQVVEQEKKNDVNNTEVIVIDDDDSDEQQQPRDNGDRMRPDSGWPPALLAAAADVAPPIVHVSTTAKQTAEKSSFERNIPEHNIPADGIVTAQVVQQGSKQHLPIVDKNGVRLGYKDLEWNETRGVWVRVVAKETDKEPKQLAQRPEVPAKMPAKTTTIAESSVPNPLQFDAQKAAPVATSNNKSAASSNPDPSEAVAASRISHHQQQQALQTQATGTGTHTSAPEFQKMYQKQQRHLQHLNPATAAAPIVNQQQPLQQQQLNQQSARQNLMTSAPIVHQQQPLQQQQLQQQLLQLQFGPQNTAQAGALKNIQSLQNHWHLAQQLVQQQQLQQQQVIHQPQPQLHQVIPRNDTINQNQHKKGAQSNNRATPPAAPIPAVTTINASGSSNDKSAQRNPLPNLERWSEYRIDAAKSITELEAIRHRLLSLLEKTNSRLKEMRVQRALQNEVVAKDAEKLSIKELIDILSEQVEESSGNGDESAAMATTTGKRTHSEIEEQSSLSRKRQRCCPLCLCTSHLPSESNRSGASRGVATRSVTCSVCEDDGICFKCHSRCLKCLKAICADCFATCSKCNSSAYCSDCVDGGNGKCASCCKSEQQAQKRAEKRAEKRRNEPQPRPAIRDNRMPRRAVPRNEGVGGAPIESPSARRKQRDSLIKLPPPVPAQITVREADSKPSESYAEHRFCISGDIEKIGCCIRGPTDGKMRIVDIQENSLAAQHGFQEGDEVFVPGMPCDKLKSYFIAAVRDPRPMIFHVRRFCSKLADDSTVHRFVVHERGTLGVKIKRMGDTTTLSCVNPGSVAEKHGLCKNDILCKPFTNGSEISGVYDWFLNMATSNTRPFIFEVHRKKSVVPPPCYSFGDENPFLYRIPEGSSPVEANNENGKAVPATVYNLLSSDESKIPSLE